MVWGGSTPPPDAREEDVLGVKGKISLKDPFHFSDLFIYHNSICLKISDLKVLIICKVNSVVLVKNRTLVKIPDDMEKKLQKKEKTTLSWPIYLMYLAHNFPE